MKHLKTYQIFESQERKELTEEQKKFLDKFATGVWMFDHNTGLVDLNGNFDCSWKDIKDFFGVSFGKVKGTFDCSYNRLVSLEGSPQEVSGTFICSHNRLTSLEGGPKQVRGAYNCSRNRLTSLDGGPKQVGGSYVCAENPLKSLDGAPEKVGGMFSCDAFRLEIGEWNMGSWLELLDTGSAEAKQLILSLVSPEEINKRIAGDPAGMAMMLKGVWNSKAFKEIRSQLVWPKGFEKEADLVGDLGGIGF
jgi:hypothetical protein